MTRDIQVLMDKLKEHEVYKLVEGRRLDDDDSPAVDVVSEGMGSLVTGSILTDFNAAFCDLQKRRRLSPVWGTAHDGVHKNTNTPAINPQVPPPSSSPQSLPLNARDLSTEEVDATSQAQQDQETVLEGLDGSEGEDVVSEDELECDDEYTLPLLTLDDVALEMDEVEGDDEDNEHLDDDDDGILEEIMAYQ
ncbi:hypothetical protein CVT24_011658 [Panaeolus cyanescens]|uniref:Uncharacterized protein n=1 Tax=Panaeolus cyanescens TaxID=181874 RepID=A0A409X9U3_9AGAR|nr:hypothetical protein CVT24_011658 [Panaeolus cyanescens]